MAQVGVNHIEYGDRIVPAHIRLTGRPRIVYMDEPKSGARFSNETRRQVGELYESGFSSKEIAGFLDKNYRSIAACIAYHKRSYEKTGGESGA